MNGKTLRRAWTLSALAVLAATPALAQSGADFYKGKTLTYVVATSPGGGYDTYGRLVAEFMEKNLPGVTVVVRNMPGAAHTIGTNHIYASNADGLTIGTFNTGLILEQLIGNPAIKFDLARMSWIGKAASDPRMLVVAANSDIKTVDDMKRPGRPYNFSVNGADDPEVRILERALGLNIKLIAGYHGNEDQMAMRRGEIHANFSAYSAFRPFVENGYARFIVAVGGHVDGVPQLRDLVKDGSDEAKALTAILQSQGDIARLTAGPPGIPADRLAALRAAYRSALSDPAFRERAAKVRVPIDPAFGEDVEKMVRAALEIPPALKASMTSIVKGK